MPPINIYPSILALIDNPETWIERVRNLPLPITGIHYDIGDGEFVPTKMLPPENIKFLGAGGFTVDVHIMVRRPSEYIPILLSFPQVTGVIFHVECDEDVHETIQILRNAGKRVGLSLLPATPDDHLDPYLLEVDCILVMTVTGGYAGTPFIPEVLPKITSIHNKRPEVEIIVDGGINKDTLPLCIEAGVSGAVMSKALFGGDDLGWLDEYAKYQKQGE